MIRILLTACLVFLVSQAHAQQPAIVFDQTVHEFGTLKEEQQTAEHTFTFTNKGDKPLTLKDVKPSCGCTAPSWSKEPVAPGETGTIKAVYTTTNRPGKFEKFITVRALAEGSEQEQVVVLTIRGDVTPRVKTIADFFPHQDGSLRFSTNHVAMGRVYVGTQHERTLKVYNDSEIPILLEKVIAPAHIQVMAQENVTIAPKDSLLLPIIYDSKSVDDWGFIHHMLMFRTSDPADEGKHKDKRIYVSADIGENFEELTPEEMANAPVVKFDKTVHDFGVIANASKVSTDFTITNNGGRPLIIRKTKASCGCTATQPAKTVLEPGESTTIHVTFDSVGKSGKQQKSILVITNDPKQPSTNLVIKADIPTTN